MKRTRENDRAGLTGRATEQFTNHLEKTDFDRKADLPLPAIEDSGMAAQIVRLAQVQPHVHTQSNPAAGEESPLRLFGILVGTLRRKRGLELEDLSARTDLPVDTLAAIELGAAPYPQVRDCLRPLGEAFGGKYPALSRALIDLTLND